MRFIFCLLVSTFIFACSNKNIPDVSAIKVSLHTERFDKDFFAIDTNNITAELDRLVAKYPTFGKAFLLKVLGVNPMWANDTVSLYIKQYIAYSKTIYDTSQKYFSNFDKYENEIIRGLQFVKYYYPTYKLPAKIITFLGPADGKGDVIGEDFLGVGLHAHLGKDFPLYKTDNVREIYPDYVAARFTPDYIVVNCMKNIIDDMYPQKSEDKRLLVQMVENGKRLWLLSKFLPETDAYKLMGYTKEQMKDCEEHQANIWSLFIQNNFLQTADNSLIKNYVSEGPKTQELGENAPGNIGSYAGWQIVKKFITNNKEIAPDVLMKMDAEKIYQEAKYKP